MARDYVGRVAATIIEQLKQGTAPWQKPWTPGQRFMPYNPVSATEYHGMNAVWLISVAERMGYADARWVTYHQARGRDARVRKGEKGTVVQFWKWQGLERVRNAHDTPFSDETSEPRFRVVRYDRPRVWSAVVFNAEQVDGLPVAQVRPALAIGERHERADTILVHSRAVIRHVRGDRACYRLAEDAITLPERGQFADGDSYYATALHELAHWTGHPSRLNRDLVHPFGSDGYAREELRAEIASLILGEQLAIGHDPGQHVAYVAGWIRVLESDPREIFRAAAEAERISQYIRAFEREREQRTDLAAESRSLSSTGTSVALLDPDGRGLPVPPFVRNAAPTVIRENHPAMTPNGDRTYLAVPFDEKDKARALGAKWDRRVRAWYAPVGVDLQAFAPWLATHNTVHLAVGIDPREAFAQVLRDSSFRIGGLPEMDGQLHRVPVEGDKGRERSGAYVAHLDARPAGYLQNFRTGLRMYWKAASYPAALNARDRALLAAEAARKRQERAAERERAYERAAQEVTKIWAGATPVQTHPYLGEKGVGSHGLRQDAFGRLLVPVQSADGKLWSVQRIGSDGFKQFHDGGRVEGGHYQIGHVKPLCPVLIAEGYATAATLYELSGLPAVVAFNAGNLMAVARTYRQLYPDHAVCLAGDNDHRSEAEGKPNVGRQKAEEAAAAIDGCALLPVFAENDRGSDWNDLARSEGRREAHRKLVTAIAVADRERGVRNLPPTKDHGPDQSQVQASPAGAAHAEAPEMGTGS